MVGTRHVHACLAICLLTAQATPISAADTPPRATTAIPAFDNKPAGVGRVSDFPIARGKSGKSPFPAAQPRAARLHVAKRVPFGTDVGLKCVVAAMLVAYQLRRKHRALRAQPFSF